MGRPLVYIAGPYTIPDPVANTRCAILVGEDIEARFHCDVFIPHLTLLWDLLSPAPHGVWLARDSAILVRCDALVRIPGESKGADNEVYIADNRGLPVFQYPELPGLATWRADFPD